MAGLRRRVLGKTGLEVSVLGFGASPLGGVFEASGQGHGPNHVRLAWPSLCHGALPSRGGVDWPGPRNALDGGCHPSGRPSWRCSPDMWYSRFEGGLCVIVQHCRARGARPGSAASQPEHAYMARSVNTLSATHNTLKLTVADEKAVGARLTARAYSTSTSTSASLC